MKKTLCDGCHREISQLVPMFVGRTFFNGKMREITITISEPKISDDAISFVIKDDICTRCLFDLIDKIDPRAKLAEQLAA